MSLTAPKDNSNLPTESYQERRDLLLKDVPGPVIRKAWFALAHLLLDEGARVIDMGCDDGAITYAMAVLAPKVKFVGLDKSKRQITKAREKYDLHNLSFEIGDAASSIFNDESFDAVINSYVLHEVYSSSRYNERIVSDTLNKHFKLLKKGGSMFIRDFASPPLDEYVLLELLDVPSEGDTLLTLSDADLLMWYSEHARPRQDPGCGGFFLEELPPRTPRTRLFRLPHKWAYEFIMRKDDRAHWETGLPLEFTFFTARDFTKELSLLGARVQYSAPYWEDDIVDKQFEGKFKLYGDDSKLLGYPPTCYVVVAHKMGERKSLRIEERRPSHIENSKLKISALRHEKTGQIVDVVSRGINSAEIIPYRLDEEDCLKIYLHDGVVRSITNAVPRNGTNIDRRDWSGHMIEAVSVDHKIFIDMENPDTKKSARFSRDYLGLLPAANALLEKGPQYYPSPDYIDESVHTYYLKVEQKKVVTTPRHFLGHNERFQAKGALREMDAQQVLNAITVGMIPNARLELQILSLFSHLKIKAENWTGKNISFQVGEITGNKDLHKIMKQLKNNDKKFREIKGSSGQLRAVHSTFVEEGQTKGAMTGLSAQDIDFVVFDNKTTNTAVVLPMSKDLKDEVHAGFFLETMPVPELNGSGGPMITAPYFNLPRNITNMQQAKKYIADQFGVLPQMVFKTGESYYNHISLTPQKIHPFGVAVPPDFFESRKMEVMPLSQLMFLYQQWEDRVDANMGVVFARSYKLLGQDQIFDAKLRAKNVLKEGFDKGQNAWSLPMVYYPTPGTETSVVSAQPAEKISVTTPALTVVEPTSSAPSTSKVIPWHAREKTAPAKAPVSIPSGALIEHFDGADVDADANATPQKDDKYDHRL